jgi:hypothetical protein
MKSQQPVRTPTEDAAVLLRELRATTMRRGPTIKSRRELRGQIEETLLGSIPAPLAHRMAFQLVLKFSQDELGDHATWRALGELLREEITALRASGLADRRIIQILPKLSAADVEALIEEIARADRRIVRTILSAAAEAADPLAAGRRFLAEYQLVVKRFEALDPKVARTLANATFMAAAPLGKAVDFYRHFAQVAERFPGDPSVSRMVAKATLRNPSPSASDELLERYKAAQSTLVSQGMDIRSARSISTLRRLFDVRGGADTAPPHDSKD